MNAREQLLQAHGELCEKARQLMEAKNADYSNGGDPFHNFRGASFLHVDPVKGALIRLQDKVARLVSFLDRGDLKVKDESVDDTIIDMINYSVIVREMIREKKEQAKCDTKS